VVAGLLLRPMAEVGYQPTVVAAAADPCRRRRTAAVLAAQVDSEAVGTSLLGEVLAEVVVIAAVAEGAIAAAVVVVVTTVVATVAEVDTDITKRIVVQKTHAACGRRFSFQWTSSA
jgi:hypothetical protein